MPFRSIPPEQWATADRLKDEGKTIADIHRETGIGVQSLYKRYRDTSDPRPGGRAKPPPKVRKKATDEQLVSLFTKAAVAPAIPAGLWLQCDFCANHFVTTGPTAAAKLVELSHDEPALRRVMEWLHSYAQDVAWATILATWLGVPIAHHLAPDFAYRWLAMPLGLPPRGAPVASTNGHAPHAHEYEQSAPEPTPFAGMDLESILGMARSMGITIELPDDAVTTDENDVYDATTESSPNSNADNSEPDAAADAADDAAPDETVTSDTDTG